MTNFPFGTQVLTGLFLNVTASGPQGSSQSFSRALVDRIGFAARQGAVSTPVSLPPGTAPALTNYDTYTLDVTAAAADPNPTAELNQQLQAEVAQLAALQSSTSTAPAAQPFARGVNLGLTRVLGNNFLTLSQLHTQALASDSGVVAYFARPRVVLISNRLLSSSSGSSTSLGLATAIDLINDSVRVEGEPGQSVAAPVLFNGTRGMFENLIERDLVAGLAQGGQAPSVDNTYDVFNAAVAQGIGLAMITPDNLGVLDGLNLTPDAKARITADVQQGFGVIVPDQMVLLNGAPTIAWAEINLTTGEYIGVDANGGHQGAFEYLALVGEGLELQLMVIKFFSPVAGIDAGIILGFSYQLRRDLGDQVQAAKDLKDQKDKVEKLYKDLVDNGELAAMLLKEGIVATILSKIKKEALPDIEKIVRDALGVAENAFNAALDATVFRMTGHDPGVTGILGNPLPLSTLPANQANATASVTGSLTAGQVQGTDQTTSISVAKQLAATWSSSATSAFQATSLSASGATVVSSGGQTVGMGTVTLTSAGGVPMAVSGNNSYSVHGTGSLSFYGPAETNLGVSGNWDSYSATVTGNVTITLTTSGLTLNGQVLPAGTYTITTASASLGGSGPSTAPNFTGSASITATGGTVDLGPGSGNVTLGGQAIDPTNGATLTGYTGSLTITANGGAIDKVALNGTAANVLQVSASSATLTAQAPAGWKVTLDSQGNVTATPPPGLQGGTFAIRLIATSTTNPDLVAQALVQVTVLPTQPGITLAINPDPQFTVPFNGAQLPTAFQALIHNSGPAADTFQLTFPTIPAGFTLISSQTQVTIPAGQTGIIGLYLQPNGSQLPAPGTNASFTVTATSTSNPAVTATQTENFTVPQVDGVTLTSNSPTVTTTPGTQVSAPFTLTNVGNVSESVSFSVALPPGVTAPVLDPITLAVGQTIAISLPLTPAAN
ncbi:MAG: hypothetical protein JO112_11750, partial [Planctomycetes bacterium]|nr:hypothetical protein [Planctomycetota bacterium]